MSLTLPLPTNGTVQAIYPSGADSATTIKNTGNNAAFIDGDNNPLSGGYELSPGSTIVWDVGNPLFGSCVAGAPTTLSLTPNSGNVFDASAVATAILDQGLADAIAAAITLNGVPTIDPLPVIYSEPLWIAAHDSPPIAVGGYLSLRFRLIETTNSVVGGGIYTTVFQWYSSTGVLVHTDYCTMRGGDLVGAFGVNDFVVPVRGPVLVVSFPSGLAGNTWAVNILGSYRQATALRGEMQTLNAAGIPTAVPGLGSVSEGFLAISGGGVLTPRIPTRTGRAVMTGYFVPTTAGQYLSANIVADNMVDAIDFNQWLGITPGIPAGGKIEVIFPQRPVSLFIATNVGGLSKLVTIEFDPF